MLSDKWNERRYHSTISLDGSINYVYLHALNDVGQNDILITKEKLQGFESIQPITLLGDEHKFVLRMDWAFYHAISDGYAPILSAIEEDPNIHIVLIANEVDDRRDLSMHPLAEFAIKFLEAKGVRYTYIAENARDLVLCIKNFTIIKRYEMTKDDVGNLSDMVKFLGLESAVEPYRKVYLSRRGIPGRPRLDNELDFEKYLQSFGIEIVYPEDKFRTIEEQIKYMQEVRLLISVTSSGLMNLLFMQEKQTIVELQVHFITIINGEEFKDLHTQYSSISNSKKHDYVLLPNDNKTAEALNTFESKLFLRNILES